LYVFYDVSDRPVYVGKAEVIKKRVSDHVDKFWFKYPIVSHAAYVEIKGTILRHQVEQVLIKFLKSNAVINKQSVDRE
jgi:excinuclease UvrABC nuclease subunit